MVKSAIFWYLKQYRTTRWKDDSPLQYPPASAFGYSQFHFDWSYRSFRVGHRSTLIGWLLYSCTKYWDQCGGLRTSEFIHTNNFSYPVTGCYQHNVITSSGILKEDWLRTLDTRASTNRFVVPLRSNGFSARLVWIQCGRVKTCQA